MDLEGVTAKWRQGIYQVDAATMDAPLGK